MVAWLVSTSQVHLERADVDFTALEARARLDPQVGALIGLNAAALCIVDQLGAAQEIFKHTAPVNVSKLHRGDGKSIIPLAFTFQNLKAGWDMSDFLVHGKC